MVETWMWIDEKGAMTKHIMNEGQVVENKAMMTQNLGK